MTVDVQVPQDSLLKALLALHDALRRGVLDEMVESTVEPSAVADDSSPGDTVYAIDRVAEGRLLELVADHLASWLPVVVVAEGLSDTGHGDGVASVPRSAPLTDGTLWLIVDPIDGTRGLMYGKRSAWILTGVATPDGSNSQLRLRNIHTAVQTEIPTAKQNLADTLWALRGQGAGGHRTDMVSGEVSSLRRGPSAAQTLEHGFGQVMRAFPGGRELLAAIDDEICRIAGPAGRSGKAASFEDQYISTGGQLAELVYGHDRWTADLRPLLNPILVARKQPEVLCCHPYDICSVLIAEESGVIVTDISGRALDAPLNIQQDVSWVGYANEAIRAKVEPALFQALRKYGLSPGY